MPSATKKAAKSAASSDKAEPKRTRTVLSPDEKIAKLEADLAAVRAKKVEKEGKARKDLVEKRDKLVAKRNDLNTQIDKLNLEVEEIDAAAPASDEGAGA